MNLTTTFRTLVGGGTAVRVNVTRWPSGIASVDRAAMVTPSPSLSRTITEALGAGLATT